MLVAVAPRLNLGPVARADDPCLSRPRRHRFPAPLRALRALRVQGDGGRGRPAGGLGPSPGGLVPPPGLGPPRLDFRPASREQPVRGCSQSHGPGPPPAGPDAELPRPMDLTNGILTPALLDPGVLTLGVSQIVIGLLTVGFLACSILLVLTVLIQRPQGGGLSGAFGAGAGSGETAFGARTGDALTIATISFFVLWLVVAVGLVLVMSPPKVTNTNPAATSNQAPVQPGDTGPRPRAGHPRAGRPRAGRPRAAGPRAAWHGSAGRDPRHRDSPHRDSPHRAARRRGRRRDGGRDRAPDQRRPGRLSWAPPDNLTERPARDPQHDRLW